MDINLERILEDIEEIAKHNTTPNKGITRYSYTKEDFKVKEYIISEMKKLDMEVTLDKVGNIRGRYLGSNPHLLPVVSGSHVDTVKHGGKYDGALGVVGALEVARTFKEMQHSPKRHYDVLVFVEEEGSNFGSNLIGSENIRGSLPISFHHELKDLNGETLYEKIEKSKAYLPYPHDEVFYPGGFDTMIELHIEQGNSLEERELEVGIVKGIFKLLWLEVTIEGTPNHAGATPMQFRIDPMVEACSLVASIPNLIASIKDSDLVATVGTIKSFPGNINVIPEKVKFTIDLRGINPDSISRVYEVIEDKLKTITEKGFSYNLKQLTEAKEVLFKEDIINEITNLATLNNYKYQHMYSGANHDTSIMSSIGDTAMIFVTSKGGRSHCPEEFTNSSDIEKGVSLLAETIYKFLNR